MQSLFKLCNMVYFLALAIWLSVLVSAGIAAGSAFGVLNKMDISIAKYSEFLPDEAVIPNAHSNLAAGHVLEPVFFITSAAQFVAIPLVLLTLAVQLLVFKQYKNKSSNIIRTVCIIISAGLFAYHAFAITPLMNRDLRNYWQSAEAGDIQAAITHRQGLLSRHDTATNILTSTLLLVLIATAASAATMTPLLIRQTASNLQTPQLAEK